MVVVVVVDVAVVVVAAVFPQPNSWGPPSIYNCTLTNLFYRVGGLRVLSFKKNFFFFFFFFLQRYISSFTLPSEDFCPFLEGGCRDAGSVSLRKIVSTQANHGAHYSLKEKSKVRGDF